MVSRGGVAGIVGYLCANAAMVEPIDVGHGDALDIVEGARN